MFQRFLNNPVLRRIIHRIYSVIMIHIPKCTQTVTWIHVFVRNHRQALQQVKTNDVKSLFGFFFCRASMWSPWDGSLWACWSVERGAASMSLTVWRNLSCLPSPCRFRPSKTPWNITKRLVICWERRSVRDESMQKNILLSCRCWKRMAQLYLQTLCLFVKLLVFCQISFTQLFIQ